MPTTWRTHGEAYVAFLDVLGFGQLVKHSTHAELEEVYRDALLSGFCLGLSNRKYTIVEHEGQECLTNDVTAAPVNSLIVSDSIVVWTVGDSARAFRDIVSVVRGVMAHSCFNGLPLRGAIDVGEVSWLDGRFDSSTYNVQQSVFGSGLCAAHDLEKQQEWSGCVVSDRAIARFQTSNAQAEDGAGGVDELIRRKELCNYDVPLKAGLKRMYVVDWVNHAEVRARSSTVGDAFIKHQKLKAVKHLADCPSVKAKIENTLRFVRHVFPDADKEGMAAVWAAFHR